MPAHKIERFYAPIDMAFNVAAYPTANLSTAPSTQRTMSRFTDFGDEGTYTGDLRGDKRHGAGKMVYDSGNIYEGGFVNDLFEGKGVYTWNGRLLHA